MYRLIVRINTDQAGAAQATQAVKQLLEPQHGPVGTITVEEWVWEAHAKVPDPFAADPLPHAEHEQRGR